MISKKSVWWAAVAALVVLDALASSTLAWADPPAPPEPAFTACEAKAAGDACSAQLGDRTLAGTCRAHPAAGRLFCMPDHPPPRPERSGRTP